MSTALVLGDHGSGLTTFVGLLYTAQVRLGTEDSDEFRFHADRETIRQLEAVYGELGAGRFPVRDSNWEENPLSFLFGFRQGRLRGLTRGGESNGEFDTVRIQVGGIPTDEVAELRNHDAVLQPGTRRLLRSQMVLPLIDATALTIDPDDRRTTRLAAYDKVLSVTLDHLGKFLAAEQEKKARRMYPMFVVTKTDAFHIETLQQLSAPRGLPTAWSADDRRSFGRRLLKRFFPETVRYLEASHKDAGLTILPPDWYHSRLAIEDANGERKIRRRSLGLRGGWEPEYPFEEYRALIEKLGSLAHKLPSEPDS